jgi:hypothetical protein
MDLRDRIAELSDDELVEIRGAATWYAKLHARIVAERADDCSAQAVAQRDRYLTLIGGLRKLGARIVDPTAPVASLTPLREARTTPTPILAGRLNGNAKGYPRRP